MQQRSWQRVWMVAHRHARGSRARARRGIRTLMNRRLDNMIRRDEMIARHRHARRLQRYPKKTKITSEVGLPK